MTLGRYIAHGAVLFGALSLLSLLMCSSGLSIEAVAAIIQGAVFAVALLVAVLIWAVDR